LDVDPLSVSFPYGALADGMALALFQRLLNEMDLVIRLPEPATPVRVGDPSP
jgi:hypothetical protein